MGKKKKKNEKSPAETALLVEKIMAELEVVAEEDAELNRQAKPAVNKLKKLPLLMEVLAKLVIWSSCFLHFLLYIRNCSNLPSCGFFWVENNFSKSFWIMEF